MRILKSNFEKGFAKLKIEFNDDLWYLHSILEQGDFIVSRTLRNLFLNRGEQKIKVEKKPMILKIRLEKIEFQKNTNHLRLTGKITEGPEDVQLGSYHTIDVEVGTVLTINKKEWKSYQIQKIKKAQIKTPNILIVVVDSDEVVFGLLKNNRVEIKLELKNSHSIQEEDKQQEFYDKIATEIDKLSATMEKIILAGPGFTKEHVQTIIQHSYPETNKKLILETVYSATQSGINEILKKGTLDKILKDSEVIKESKIVQEFFTHLNKDDGLSVYGLDDIMFADSAGAVETLLVSEDKMRDEKIEKLANEVEGKKGNVEIISKEHDLGEQFTRMGGLGAILRFRMS
jgi:protein pelota